jgi:hypothetical protein
MARYGKLGQKVAGWVDAVEQAMGSGKQGSKPALSAASTAWNARFLPIVYHAFCVIATILHKPYIIWFLRYLRAHSHQSRRSSRF